MVYILDSSVKNYKVRKFKISHFDLFKISNYDSFQ